MTAAKKKQAHGTAEEARTAERNTEPEISALKDTLIKEIRLYNAACASLGRYYADLHKSNPEPIFSDIVLQINTAKDKIKTLKDALAREEKTWARACRQCGAETVDGASFCTVCGAQISRSAKERRQGIVCPACKHKNHADAAYCTRCGVKLNNYA